MTRSRLLGLGLGAFTLVCSTVVPAPPAHAEEVPIPSTATITLNGHGWGHGIGMSQYGAQGAASQGKSWRRIVSFYYPGTVIGRARGDISVLITAATSSTVMVDAHTGLRLHPVDGKKSFLLTKIRPKATRWRIQPKGTKSIVSYKAHGSGGWRKWASFNGDAEFTAGNQPTLLRLPGTTPVAYRGALRATQGTTINILPLDSYVQGVVAREVPAEWPAQAVRAQAVAARSYAAYVRDHSTTYYDICDTSSCQVYGGQHAEQPESNQAVAKTRSRVVTYQGRPAFTQFSSSSGGWSTAGSQPYLVAQQDPFEASSTNPNANWTVTLTDADIEKAYPLIGDLQKITFARDGHGDFGGRVTTVTLAGSLATGTVTGDSFRSVFGLRSTYFSLSAAQPPT